MSALHNPLYTDVPSWVRLSETRQAVCIARKSRARTLVENPCTGKPYQVAQIDITTGKTIAIFPNCRAAGESIGGCRSNISKCCNGQVKTSGGYIWKKVVDIQGENI